MTGSIQITGPLSTEPTVMLHYIATGSGVKTRKMHHVPCVGDKIVLTFRQHQKWLYRVTDIIRLPEWFESIEHVNVYVELVSKDVSTY